MDSHSNLPFSVQSQIKQALRILCDSPQSMTAGELSQLFVVKGITLEDITEEAFFQLLAKSAVVHFDGHRYSYKSPSLFTEERNARARAAREKNAQHFMRDLQNFMDKSNKKLGAPKTTTA